ncbi:MAG: hypothetical protein HKP38_10260 [Croceitalea sp.]|nr:hypothetical protein [Croceitalea sp.]MBT8238722.1 hypothetical protein [Croceitalea sp.]NNC33971.1 hypothetical protein [Croceitalea sp.]NNL09595.1 hypothetical protein [Croceitalea sp.]NNM18414.1 hypothetical protein [Croceitalea sp.]
MKRVKDTDFFVKKIREVREFEFGFFYYFEGLVISEIHEGVTFSWQMGKRAIEAAHEIFGKDNPVAYISNRVNSYQVVAKDWSKFYHNRHQLDFYSVVGNTQGSFASLVLERLFFQYGIRQFSDLEEAITWSLSNIKSRKASA